MKRYLPYLFPILVTLVFVMACYSGQYWFGMLIFPLITYFTKTLGKFSLQELKSEYLFFHHTPGMEILRGLSAVFFIGFNAWVGVFLHFHTLEWYNLLFLIYSAILINANFAISLAHDLMHSVHPANRFFGTVVLLLNGFFYLEMDHIYIHHRFVGTAADPASALRGEGLYTYLKRSVSQRLRIIFGGEGRFSTDVKEQIRRKSLLRLFICLAFLVLIYMISLQYTLCVLSQYLFVTFIYEIITYIQHYGLRRQSDQVRLQDAWNCYYRLSAYMHYMMPVHSIHHLKTEPDIKGLSFTGPSFPEPFSRMALYALQPKKWKTTMERALNAGGYED